MKKAELVERAKMYLELLLKGIHPVTGEQIPTDSTLLNDKVKNCFEFISGILDEYVALSDKVETLEKEKEANTIVVMKKQAFSISREQCQEIKLSKEPISLFSLVKNINSVINTQSMEKMTSTVINKWLVTKGLLTVSKVPTTVNKTVFSPSDLASNIGIQTESMVNRSTGEVNPQIKFSESAQLFIIENIEEITGMTSQKK